ncbi:hypothetical protein JXQ70_00035 [bacterium]|nr:hypothetical protein [bacterium]
MMKHNYYVLFFILILILFLSCIRFSFTIINQPACEEILTDLYGLTELTQTFRVRHPLDAISVNFATFKRQNRGALKISYFRKYEGQDRYTAPVSGSTRSAGNPWQYLGEVTLPLEQLIDNHHCELPLPEGLRLERGQYALTFSNRTGSAQNYVSPWLCFYDMLATGRLSIQQRPVIGAICFRAQARSNLYRFLIDLITSDDLGYLSDIRTQIAFLWAGILVCGLVSFISIIKGPVP